MKTIRDYIELIKNMENDINSDVTVTILNNKYAEEFDKNNDDYDLLKKAMIICKSKDIFLADREDYEDYEVKDVYITLEETCTLDITFFVENSNEA